VTDDASFKFNEYLHKAVDALGKQHPPQRFDSIKQERLPLTGLGEENTLDLLAPLALGEAAYLDGDVALAHMDPPTPWITWATQMWNARLNQNLLHIATSPFAKQAEDIVISWLAPYFGMDGGHMCSGSTIANLTALWAARDLKHAKTVISSTAAHISVKKAATILGMNYIALPTNSREELDLSALPPSDVIKDACLVLTAGTTSAGAIDPLTSTELNEIRQQIKWLHIDAAWAGPLRLSSRYQSVLAGIEHADSVAVSAHKWLYQPKDSALIFFKDTQAVNPAISEGSSYLATPNVGVQGSRGAAAVSLLAMLLAWGKDGLATRIDKNMDKATKLERFIKELPSTALQPSNNEQDALIEMRVFTPDGNKHSSGVVLFRPSLSLLQPIPQSQLAVSIEDNNKLTAQYFSALPDGLFSTCKIGNTLWLRSVSANPNADMDKICEVILQALQSISENKT
jgi:glutamate/tyrosine decarboxylase-like PLP-dependent enzyme